MDYKLFILSLACLSCLTPPALGTLTALKAAAAVKGAALLGAGALAVKGAALKGAAIKGAVLKGAAIKGAILKGAALKGAVLKGAALGAVKLAAAKGAALLAAKGAAVKGALSLVAKAASLAVHKLPAVQPVIIEEPVLSYSVPTIVPANSVAVQTSPPHLPVLNSLTSLWSAAVQHKAGAIGGVLDSLQPSPAIIRAPIVYESYRYAEPRFYPLPVPMLPLDDDCA